MLSDTYPTRSVQQAHVPALLSSKSLPERSKLQLPLKGIFSTAVYKRSGLQYFANSTRPTLSPPTQPEPTKDRLPRVVSYEPAQYTLDDGPRDVPGTAAYYKSWVFRQKVNAGAAQVPNLEDEDGEEIEDSDDEGYDRKPRQKCGVKSLVMVFSRTNARRANAQRKVHERLQRSNRRLKFLRKLEGAERFFKWD